MKLKMNFEKEQASLLFEGFYRFLEASGIFLIKRRKEVEQRYLQLKELFLQKIRRCEVGCNTVNPDQIVEQLTTYEVLSEIIFDYIKQEPYLLDKKDIILTFLEEEIQEKEIHYPFTGLDLVRTLHEQFNIKLNSGDMKLEDADFEIYIQNIIIPLVRNSFGYDYPEVLIINTYKESYHHFMAQWKKKEKDKEKIIRGALECVQEKGWMHEKFIFELFSNIVHLLLHFLEQNQYIKYEKGKIKENGIPIQKGLQEYKKVLKSMVSPAMHEDVEFIWKPLSKRVRETIKSGSLNSSDIINNIFIIKQNQLEKMTQALKITSNNSKTDEGKGEVMRTFTVGLRVPESLRKPFNALVQEREVLKFFQKGLKGYLQREGHSFTLEGFLKRKNLLNANPTLKKKYIEVFGRYNNHSLFHINIELNRIKKQMDVFKVQQGIFTIPESDDTMSKKKKSTPKEIKLPKISDPACPTVEEISLHDYERIAMQSVKLLGAHLNTVATRYIREIPLDKNKLIQEALVFAKQEGKKITKGSLRGFPERAISMYLKKQGIPNASSNLHQIAYKQMDSMLEVYRDNEQKIKDVRRLLFSPPLSNGKSFTDVAPVLLGYYSLPNHLRGYLSVAWDVEREWVRNTWVGWRRKVDAHLPTKFQLEPLTDFFASLAEYCHQFVNNIEELKVVSRLQHYHVLHLFLATDLDLTPLLKKESYSAYHGLKARLPSLPKSIKKKIEERLIHISPKIVKESLQELMSSVEDTMSRLEVSSASYKRCKTFMKKIELIKKCHDENERCKTLFKYYLPGNRFTGAVAKLLRGEPVMKRARIARLFTALRGICARAIAQLHPKAIAHLKSVFIPKNCLTLPYYSTHRKKKYLPVNVVSPKYGILRRAHPRDKKNLNNEKASQLLVVGKPLWIGIPIYSPNQQVNGLIKDKRKGLFWFQLFPRKEIIHCLNNGAVLRNIRFNIPRGPSRKITVDLSFSAKSKESFAFQGNFLWALDRMHGKTSFPKGDFLGSDFNPIGKYMIAIATPEEEIDLLKDTNLMQPYIEAKRKLEHWRNVLIPNLQQKLDLGMGSDKKKGRWKAELTLLHRKRELVMKHLKKEVLRLYLYIGYRTGAKYHGWDAIAGISPRGKRGTLATAITYMPKEKQLYSLFETMAESLHEQGLLPAYKGAILIEPLSSKVCGDCFAKTGKARHTRLKGTPYHDHICGRCGKYSNRHSNSAMVCANLVKRAVAAST